MVPFTFRLTIWVSHRTSNRLLVMWNYAGLAYFLNVLVCLTEDIWSASLVFPALSNENFLLRFVPLPKDLRTKNSLGVPEGL